MTGRVKPGQNGAAHPAWRGNEVSVDAGRVRAQRRYPDGAPCERCGMRFNGGHSVERHHRDGNTLNNEPENIGWLCSSHHAEAHRMRAAMERRTDHSPRSSDGRLLVPMVLDDLALGVEPEDDPPAPMARTEACACGGVIFAANNPGMILAAVAAHNETAEHAEWRAVHALQRPARRACPCHDGGAA